MKSFHFSFLWKEPSKGILNIRKLLSLTKFTLWCRLQFLIWRFKHLTSTGICYLNKSPFMYFLHQKKYFYLQLWCHNALWHHSHDWLTWIRGRLPGVLGYRRGLRGLWGWLMGRLWGCLGPALGTTLWVLVAWWGITPRSWWVASTAGGRGVTGRGSIVWWGSSCCTTWGGGLWYVCAIKSHQCNQGFTHYKIIYLVEKEILLVNI